MGTDAAEALSGVRVLDFTEWLPGPYASMLLSAFGADVVKVERPASGDPSRSARPGMFLSQNKGKCSIVIDLKSTDGVRRVSELARSADVLLEGFRPGVMTRLGLGYDHLAADNPDLIYVSISGYGADGPYRDKPGHDINYMAMTGAIPTPAHGHAADFRETPLPMADLAGALFAVIGVLAAMLASNSRATRGAWLDLAIADCTLSLMQPRISEALYWQDDQGWHSRPGYGIFEAADGRFIALGAMEDHFWNRLIATLKLVELDRPEYRTWADRRSRFIHIDSVLRRRISELPADTVLAQLATADVPANEVQNMTVAPLNEQFRSRRMVSADTKGNWVPAAWPAALRQFMRVLDLPDAPDLGRETDQIDAAWPSLNMASRSNLPSSLQRAPECAQPPH